MKDGCVQKPKVGQTLKIDFDLFPTAATRIASSSSSARIEIVTKIFTPLTSATPSQTPSPSAAMFASSASTIATSSSTTTTAAASSHDKKAVRVGVGVGVGVGGALAIAGAVVICLILSHRHRLTQRKQQSEQDARALARGWMESPLAGIEEPNPYLNRDHQISPSELGGQAAVEHPFEVDAGRPRNEMVHMLDSSTVTKESRRAGGTVTKNGMVF